MSTPHTRETPQPERAKLRGWCKSALNGVSLALTFPSALSCWMERWINRQSETVYLFWAQFFALAPGLPGVYLRRAFYRQTLRSCAADFSIGFGALFTHRTAAVESGVYVGPYALIGAVVLRTNCLVGSRASLLSGGHQHVLDAAGHWTPTRIETLQQIEVGASSWLGEGALVMAHIGAHAMVAAGAVVSAPVPDWVMVAGNPARFVRRLHPVGMEPAALASDVNHTAEAKTAENSEAVSNAARDNPADSAPTESNAVESSLAR